MSRISRKKEKYGNGNELSGDNVIEGTAARTRPFSFEEIMLRRKNKKVTADEKEGGGDPGKLSGKNSSDHDGGHKRGKDSDIIAKHTSEDTLKRIFRKKEETPSLKECDLAKDKVKRSRDQEAKSKDKSDKHTHNRAKDSNQEKRSHYRGRNEERSRDENEHKKRHSGNLIGKEKYEDKDKVKSGRESKRKNISRDEEKNRQERNENSVKKYDSDRYFDSGQAERKSRKKDLSQSHYEEPRQKRRRSRSRENRDKDKKSDSPSPSRVHKRTYNEKEHGESAVHASKDRKQLSDADRNIVSSNGGYTSSHRHHSGHGSKLGGYSPRKRRTEAAIKTPSPPTRSPEKKNAGWDLPPTGASTILAGSSFQQSHQIVSSSEYDFSSSVLVTPNIAKSLSESSPNAVSLAKHISIESVQLTEATRPMRRLYVENIPASASDKSVVECLNKFLLPSGANHIQGTQACISCIINKEKGQALVEFLTPEYATAALSFDGRSFSGSVLRVRRPKDFTDAATAVPEKPVPAVEAISNIVEDSPHKIFIGGISKVMSSDMLQEIVCAFGVLKAYRFQANEDFDDSCAFLEYLDQSLTLKACAGLNGMKLGGQVLTVLQADPDASIEENVERPPFYGIPERAKPLLTKPTKVLKLKNLFNSEDLASISEPDLEETLEDIRLECARFGTVRSVNVVRGKSSCATDPQASVVSDQTDVEAFQASDVDGYAKRLVTLEENMDGGNSILEISDDDEGPANDNQANDIKSEEDVSKNGMSEPSHPDSSRTPEVPNSDAHPQDDGADLIPDEGGSLRNSSIDEEGLKQVDLNGESSVEYILDGTEKGNGERQVNNPDDIFEPGCVVIEYVRTEACCMAAHCLHGRLYGDQIVAVNYIPHDLYLLRFPK